MKGMTVAGPGKDEDGGEGRWLEKKYKSGRGTWKKFSWVEPT